MMDCPRGTDEDVRPRAAGPSVGMPSCLVCERETAANALEQADVSSNVRLFSQETFAYWRCRHCGSIHARDEVDLARYYALYPFHELPTDWRFDAIQSRQLARLRRAGLKRSHKIL